MAELKETDQLKYRGNRFPLFLVLIWLVLFAFGAGYLGRYMWPDLKVWLQLSP